MYFDDSIEHYDVSCGSCKETYKDYELHGGVCLACIDELLSDEKLFLGFCEDSEIMDEYETLKDKTPGERMYRINKIGYRSDIGEYIVKIGGI